MGSPFLGEFLGTLVMILLGDGVVAGVLLKRSKAEGGRLDGDHQRMGVRGDGRSVHGDGMWQQDSVSESRGRAGLCGLVRELLKLLGQCCGGVVGCVLWRCAGVDTLWSALERNAGRTGQAGDLCTVPAIRSAAWNFVSEVIGTLTLVFVVATIFSKQVAATGPAGGLGPYLVGALVWGIGLSLGGTTGYAINPARDLGPRIAHAVLPNRGKRRIGLGLCGDPDIRSITGRGDCRIVDSLDPILTSLPK